MGRAPCCDKASVKKGPWSPEEDAKLKEYIEKFGTGGNWIALPQKAGLRRCGKSCRLRWLNYLRPNIKHGEFSDEEDRVICSLYANIGSRWSIIAAQLPGRTDNDIKNYWNTKLKKKLMGFVTSSHKIRPLNHHHHHHYQHQIITNGYNNNNYYPQISSLLQASSLLVSSNNNNNTTFPCYETNIIPSTIPLSTSFLSTGASASCTSGITTGTFQESNFVGPATSSDESYGVSNLDFRTYMYNGVIGGEEEEEDHSNSKFLINEVGGEKLINGNINGGGCYVDEQQNPLDYSSLEEIKELISTNHGTCNNHSLFLDHEIKTEEKVMMYY